MLITKEHIGSFVKARSWPFENRIQVLSVKSGSFSASRRGKRCGGFTCQDGSNPWELVSAPKETPVSQPKFETFYILWQPVSHLPPTRKFTDRKEAYEVAEYMTRKHKVDFYVMKAHGHCIVAEAPIQWRTVGGKNA